MRALLVASVVVVVGIMATIYVLAFPTEDLSGQPHALIAVEPPSGQAQSSSNATNGQRQSGQQKAAERLPQVAGEANSGLPMPGVARAPGAEAAPGQPGQMGNRRISGTGAPEPAGIPGLLIAPMPAQLGGQTQ